jgi:hypothetical protein
MLLLLRQQWLLHEACCMVHGPTVMLQHLLLCTAELICHGLL